MVSPQQPSQELDAELSRVLAENPEWRARLAVIVKSASLRQKILATPLTGGRAVGSSALGGTHPWRKHAMPDHFSDHTWPRAVPGGYRGQHYLPGGSSPEHEQLLRSTANQLRMNPLMSRSQSFSIGKDKRFQYATDSGEVDHKEAQRREPPGPGEYFKSVPLGPGFSVDGGETVILGANHVCPWKRALGHHINPVHADLTTLTSQPAFTFSKTRRGVSDTSLGHAGQVGGPAKTDLGNLSPGHVYEHTHSIQPAPKAAAAGGLPPMQLYTSEIDDSAPGDEWRVATQSSQIKGAVGKIQVSVGEFSDQELGDAKAKLRLALYDARGRLAADCDLFGTYRAPGYAYTGSPSRMLNANEAVVTKAKRGFVYALEYCVGSGDGHTLRVRDWRCRIFPEGYVAAPKPKRAGSAAAGPSKAKGVRCVPVEPEAPKGSDTS
jgi:hypothetical protein